MAQVGVRRRLLLSGPERAICGASGSDTAFAGRAPGICAMLTLPYTERQRIEPNMSETETQGAPKITAYLKTFCGWSEGVRAVMRKYELDFEEKDIIKNPAFRWEMEHKSGQALSPCVEVNGEMLADVSGQEVEDYMVEKGLLQHRDEDAGAPTDAGCSAEQHEAMARAASVQFIKE